ncbi:MAG: CRISPR-associated endonuclease Cas2, partial [bacterium]|nr:CRISPR-associated endonuclease Cas2 [bacterium]
MKYIKRHSLTGQILKGLAAAGLLMIAASNPYSILYLIKGFKGRNENEKERWRKFYRSLNYLDKRGYVKLTEKGDGNLEARLTRLGRTSVERINFDELELPKPGKWDGKWRLVIFDIPNRQHKNRLAFAHKLKELGFIMVQKSVWAYPFECHKEVAFVRRFYEVDECATYLEAL